jgi:uncharacterized membrane protein YkvA (DUF1232 family)
LDVAVESNYAFIYYAAVTKPVKKESKMSSEREMWHEMSADSYESDLDRVVGRNYWCTLRPINPIWNRAHALWRYAKDPHAKRWGRALAIGALIYLVSPIDAVPDPIPVVGLLDDAAVIGAAVAKLYDELRPYLR